MKILNPRYEILTEISAGAVDELQHIEKIGRVCYKSEDKITAGSAEKFVSMLIRNGHEAMIEHSVLSVKFYTDRGVSHEIVRHRIASFAQESTRYCNYSADKFDNNISVMSIKNVIESDPTLDKQQIYNIIVEWCDAMFDAERHYHRMIEYGARPQIARSVLPTSTKTEIVVTANYREWRNFFKLRTAAAAHPQMRELTKPLLQELKEKIPVVFDDIEV